LKSDDHAHGGLAYYKRVKAVRKEENGRVNVDTTDDIPEDLFPSGKIALDWNSTKKTFRRRTSDEIKASLPLGHELHKRLLYDPG